MRKRVLLVESSDSVRGVTETILRQNGYEVISVAGSEKADEILKLSRPDLLIVGDSIRTASHEVYYERLHQETPPTNLPILLLASSESSLPPIPAENLISQPFDPQALLQKVAARIATAANSQPRAAEGPLGDSAVNDDFLDAALGLDNIDVTDSEVMDKTFVGRIKKPRSAAEKAVGYDHFSDDDPGLSETSRIESLIIDEDKTDIGRGTSAPKTTPPLSATGKLDIADDQYGLTAPATAGEAQAGGATHDYNWFVESMRNEAEASSPPATEEAISPEQPQPDDGVGSGPSAGSSGSVNDPTGKGRSGEPRSEGVDGFIDEFKKEMELLRTNEPESIVIKEDGEPSNEVQPVLAWEERLEKLSVEEIGVFTNRFVASLAEKIAAKLVDKLDSDKLLRMIKEELIEQSGRGR